MFNMFQTKIMNRWRVVSTQSTGLLSQATQGQSTQSRSGCISRKASTQSSEGDGGHSWVAAGTVAAATAAALAYKLYQENDRYTLCHRSN